MTPGKLIPTPLQLQMASLGRLGKGPAELTHLLGACVDAGFHYDTCLQAIGAELAALEALGKIEHVDIQSPFAAGVVYRTWRIAGSTPMESPAAPVAVPAGHISAADYMRSGAKNTQRKRK